MSALRPGTLLRMSIDKSMGFGLQKYAGIKDMNLAMNCHPDCSLSRGHKGKKHPRGGKKKAMCMGGCAAVALQAQRDGKRKTTARATGCPGS